MTLDGLIDNMSGAMYFSKIDLRNAYAQVELSEQARNFTGFIAEEGVKRYTRLMYGLSPASAIFQRCLEQTLGGIKGVKFISDDMILYSKTIEEHYEILRKLFDRIRLNYEKWLFLQNELKTFSVILSSAGVKPDPEKTAILREASPPSNISELVAS